MIQLRHHDVHPGYAVPLYLVPLTSALGQFLANSTMANAVVNNGRGDQDVYLYHYNPQIILHELTPEDREELENYRVQYIPTNDEVVEALRGPRGHVGPIGAAGMRGEKGEKGDPA